MEPEETQPEDTRSLEKKKKDAISVYAAIIAGLLIAASFVWHLISALEANP